MYTLDLNFLNDRKDSTVKQVLHEINHFKYKNFSERVTECFASRPLKKIVLNLADSLFKKHIAGGLSQQDFNKLIGDTVATIIKEDSFIFPDCGNASRQQIRDQKEQLVNIMLRQGLQDLFNTVAKTSKNDDLKKFITNLKNWSRQSGQSTTSVKMKQAQVSYLPPPETLEVLNTLKLQVSNYNTSIGLPIGQVSENSAHPLIAQLSQLKQDTLTNDSYRTIEIKSQDDLRMFNQMLANRNQYGKMLNHELRVDLSHYEGGDFSQDKDFTQADFSGLKLKFFVDSALGTSFEDTFKNILLEETQRFAADVALKLSEGQSIVTKNVQPQSWSVVVIETDPSKMSVGRIERELDNITGLAHLSLEGLVNSKKNQIAQFIEENSQYISAAISRKSPPEIPSTLIDQYLTKQVQDLRGMSSPQSLKINDEEILPFLKNIKQMELNLKTVLQEMDPQIDVTYKPLTQTESFSNSIKGLKSNLNSLPDLNTRVNLLAAIYQQEEQQNLINGISDKFTNTSVARQFIDEYIEQRFQPNVDKKDRVASEIAFETFIRKSSVVYGLSGEDLKDLTIKCEEDFRAKSTIDLVQPEENKIFRFTTQSNSEVFGELTKDFMTQLYNFAFKDAERQKILAKQEGKLGECETRLAQEASLLDKLFETQSKPLAVVLSDLFLGNPRQASDILNSVYDLVSEKNTQFSTQYPNIGAKDNPLEILKNNLLEYMHNFQKISEMRGDSFASKYLITVADFQPLAMFSQRGIDHMFSDPIPAENDLKALMIELNTEAMNQSLLFNLTTSQKALLDNVLNLYIFNDDGVSHSNYTAATDAFMNIVKEYSYTHASESLQHLLLPYVQDFLTPKDILIEQALTQSFKDPSFNNYSQEQKSLYIDLQKQSQELSNSDFSNYIITNLFEKYFENVEKRTSTESFNQFASRTIAVVNSIDSSLEQASVFKREPDLTKISTNESFQAVSEVLKNPKTLITNILPSLDKTFIHDLPGYNQITDQVKSAFIDTLLGNFSFEMVSDTLAKLLQGSIPSKETVMTVPVNEDFNPDLYNRVISNNGLEAQVLAIPSRVNNDELLAKILEQCEIHLADFAAQANLSEDTLRQVFSNSNLGNLLEILINGTRNDQQVVSKTIISSELKRNFPDKLFSELIAPRDHEILNERAIWKLFLFAKLEPSKDSTKTLADIKALYEFITDMNSKNSPYQRFNGLVLDNSTVGFNAQFYESLKEPMAPAAMKQNLFHEINSEPNNWSESAKLGINSDKYKEFRIDILLMQRKGSSEEEIKQFVKLNLASVFDTLPENSAETVKAIEKVVKGVDSKLTSDMKAFSLSPLNLEPSIQAALDTPVNKLEKQMKASLGSETNPEINFYLETQKLATELRLAGTDVADINNAVFTKLVGFINTAAKTAGKEDFNLLALKDDELDFVAALFNRLGAENQRLDKHFSESKSKVFESSIRDLFKPSSEISLFEMINKQTLAKANIQNFIDESVINLIKSPEEESLKTQVFGKDAATRSGELKLPSGDIRRAFIIVSRDLINARRNPDLQVDLALIQGAFTENIRKDLSASTSVNPEAFFMGQYAAFDAISKQCEQLRKTNVNLGFFAETFDPYRSGSAAQNLGHVYHALKLNHKDYLESYILENFLINLDSPSELKLDNNFLSRKLNIGETKSPNPLEILGSIINGTRAASAPLDFSSHLSEYLDTNINFIKTNIESVPYIDTASTINKLNQAKLISNNFTRGDNASLNSLFKDAIENSVTFKAIPSSKANAYPSSSLAEIVTDLVLDARSNGNSSSESLDLAIYKLYKDSNYDIEFLGKTKGILSDLNQSAKVNADFKFSTDLEERLKYWETNWAEAANSANLNKPKLLDFSLAYLVKENNDDKLLVNAYRSLRINFNTQSGKGIDPVQQAESNFNLIQKFKDAFKQSNSATSSDYLSELENLDKRYAHILEAHAIPPNKQFSASVENFIKESNEILENTRTQAQPILAAQILANNPTLDSDKVEQSANAYLETYLKMQKLYRDDREGLEAYVDKSITDSLAKADPVKTANGVLQLFTTISRILDGIFTDLLKDSPKANFTPLSGTLNEIRQQQNGRIIAYKKD